MAEPKPRIGIIGSGAIGGFYGGMLACAGFDVHFLLRSEYATVKAQGLLINSRDLASCAWRRFTLTRAWKKCLRATGCWWGPSRRATPPSRRCSSRPRLRGQRFCSCKMAWVVEDLVRPFPARIASFARRSLLYRRPAQETGSDRAPGLRRGASRLSFRSAADATARQNILDEGSAFFTAAGIKCPHRDRSRPGALAEAGVEHGPITDCPSCSTAERPD